MPTTSGRASPRCLRPTACGCHARLLRRVPPALGRDLLALEMEDHYLRIHTALGSDLILLRLRDALAELGPSRGRQVHRSWWVAEGAVASAERDRAGPCWCCATGCACRSARASAIR